MKAMIFAAGLGTRLKPITDTLPKALVPICGKPLLYHAITKLKAYGYTDITVNVHHFPDMIREYLGTWFPDVKISDESAELLETGGAIEHARDLLLPCEEPFLVHNVDIVSNLDIAWFRSQMPSNALSCLLVSERKTRRYLLLDPGTMRLKGWLDDATGQLRTPFPGLDPSSCTKLAFSGIHNISPRVFEAFSECGFTGRFPIMDFYLSVCDRFPIYGVKAPNLKLIDVGKIDTLPDAERFCADILC